MANYTSAYTGAKIDVALDLVHQTGGGTAIVPGTVYASKSLVVDASRDIATLHDVTLDGDLIITAAGVLYLDADAGHSYLSETADDIVKLVVGGVDMLVVTEAATDVIGTAATQFSFDAAGQVDTSGNNLLTLTGGTAGVRIDDMLAIDCAPDANNAIRLDRSYTVGVAHYYGIDYTEAITLNAGAGNLGAAALFVEPTFTNQTSANALGTIAGIRIRAFDTPLSAGARTIAVLAGLYIDGAPTTTGGGTTTVNAGPYQIFCDGTGESRFDGDIGDATNRVPVVYAVDINASDDILLADGAVVGITGNEIITFNAAGNIAISGADLALGSNNITGVNDVTIANDILLATASIISFNATDLMTHGANLMTLSGFTTWDMGAVATLDFDGAVSITGGDVTFGAGLISTPDAITATSETVAASIATVVTDITTNSDADLDNVSLANGTNGQIKIFTVNIAGVGDTVKITPATFFGWTTITFAADGDGCIMIYNSTDGWVCVGNNGGTLA